MLDLTKLQAKFDALFKIETRYSFNEWLKNKPFCAKQIKETPVIKGEDAKSFRESMTNTEADKVTSAQMAKMQDNYNKIMSIINFTPSTEEEYKDYITGQSKGK